MQEEIRAKFAIIEDWRKQGYVEHVLADVLILVMGAVMSGITELSDMMVYFENKKDFYKEQFGIKKYPSKPTLSRILNMINGDAVGCVIAQIMREKTCDIGEIIAVDGKAIRRSEKKDKPHSFLQILSAYATESGITLSQKAISYEDKTNEIPVFQGMLDSLEVKGKTITADAMHCQKETCAKIVKKGGDYIFGLKGNQGNLYEEVKLFFEGAKKDDKQIKTFQTVEKNGGRVEKRVCRASDCVAWLPDLPLWNGLGSIFSITRTVTAKNKTTEETGYYISSLPSEPEKLLYKSRSHWQIESLHWLLDVIWHEDDCGILSENGHKTLNVLRKLSLLAHKRYVATLVKKQSIKGNVLASLLNESVLLKVLACL